MTALSAARETPRMDGDLVSIGVASAGVIYKGGLVNASAGYLVAGADTAGHRFAGVAYENATGNGTNGGVVGRVWRRGLHLFAVASAAVTDVGKRCFISDDQNITYTPANIYVGQVAKYEDSTHVWVDIEPACTGKASHRVAISGSLTAVTATTAGGVLSLLNPFAARAVIIDFIIDVTTVSTGSATVDFGVASTVASADTLIDGINVNSAVIIGDNIDNKGSNGVRGLAWPSGHYLTGTASATLAGMVGTYMVDVYLPTAVLI